MKGLILQKMPPLIDTLTVWDLIDVMEASAVWQDSDTFWLCANSFVDKWQSCFTAFKTLLNRLPIHLQPCFQLADIEKVELAMFEEKLKALLEELQTKLQEHSQFPTTDSDTNMKKNIKDIFLLPDFPFVVSNIAQHRHWASFYFQNTLFGQNRLDVVSNILEAMYSSYTTGWKKNKFARLGKGAVSEVRRLIKALKFMKDDMETILLDRLTLH